MELIELTDTKQEISLLHYEQLEAGGILFFPRTPFELSEEQYRALLSQRQTEASYHKNIAYRASEDTITGIARGSDRDQLRRILRDYCRQAGELVARLLPLLRWTLPPRFRQLSAVSGRGTIPVASLAQRPVAHRCLSHPPDKRRSNLALFHEHPPRAGTGMAHHRALSEAGRTV